MLCLTGHCVKVGRDILKKKLNCVSFNDVFVRIVRPINENESKVLTKYKLDVTIDKLREYVNKQGEN